MNKDQWRRNLSFLRKKNNESQSSIGLQLSKTQQTIANWENGIGQPNISELIEITNLFGITVQNFILSDLQKGEVIKKPNVEKNQKKGEVKGEVSGELIVSEPETYNKSPGQITLIQALQNSLHDKDELLSAQKVIISHLNARIAALERELIEAQKIYAKLKLPAGK